MKHLASYFCLMLLFYLNFLCEMCSWKWKIWSKNFIDLDEFKLLFEWIFFLSDELQFILPIFLCAKWRLWFWNHPKCLLFPFSTIETLWKYHFYIVSNRKLSFLWSSNIIISTRGQNRLLSLQPQLLWPWKSRGQSEVHSPSRWGDSICDLSWVFSCLHPD